MDRYMEEGRDSEDAWDSLEEYTKDLLASDDYQQWIDTHLDDYPEESENELSYFREPDPTDEPDHEPTKQERREAHRQRDRMGMVKHSPANVRPAKLPKGKVRFK